jgi:hypothetical protein
MLAGSWAIGGAQAISNMAQCIKPYVEVARWFNFVIRAAVASAISRARSTPPSGHRTIAK